jgi:hypothetical protein
MNPRLHIREIREEEFALLGQLMVEVYSGLEGFPTPNLSPSNEHDTRTNSLASTRDPSSISVSESGSNRWTAA